ncbi:MAG: N,N'-diacetylchitobiose phosphorylase [Subdoligranulum variabile]|uniref:GH36-type glycosyl hydrolase domain-containing protein n=1 Tax=Gemmiger sp. TaxID=2049027 RepID=UPI002A90E32D|nr:N,N'-diacetylchitobiose phosphorylase [Gemmiger sp.]MDD7639493.1 N,N'-diacetylchitobiose phosphorylase [Subdoligranulum variabile]MDY5604170.1 N,N'-diacetylchitobiose phosphorylase [Gemmiger sp.]
MQYGYFDDKEREYVITCPDTPAPWVNYLGSPEYGAIISNNAGGYSFAKSGANGRILRYVFNQFDEPGRYIYIRDNLSKDYWSASWQPVGKNLTRYKSECRHGMAYTKMRALYAGISSEVLYYVPLDAAHEVWAVAVRNDSDVVRELTVTGYAEFTNNPNYEQDQVNLQYSQFITRTEFENDHILQLIHGNLDAVAANGKEVDNKDVGYRLFGLAGQRVSGYCGNKESFLGRYHGYGDPQGVTTGKLDGSMNYNENACGALSAVLVLNPGETAHLAFIVGAKNREESRALMARYADPAAVCPEELAALKAHWHTRLENFQIHTPSAEMNSMINTWNAYNCFMTFTWSRAASLIYCGLRNGYGYRDTVQDIQGVIHLAPEQAAEKIRFMLSAQVDNGGGLPLVKFTHNPGHEDTPDDPSYVQETGHPAYRADDALWLFPTVYKYLAETGNLAFLDEVIPYANKGAATVYEHLQRAIDFSLEHLGPHGMPAGLYADWNDCLRLGAEGESSFVAFQLVLALRIQKQLAEEKGDAAAAEKLAKQLADFSALVEKLCWNEDRYIRGFTEKGEVIGQRTDPEANLWLNPQSWAVISGLADSEKAETILHTVQEGLNTEYGVMLMQPPYHAHAFDGALAVIYNAGVKENAGIFSQSQGWIILAEALCGHGNRAFSYYKANSPAEQNGCAEIRKLEPYCYGQFTEGKDSPHFGRSHVHWLTGTASTMMVGAVEGILGVRPDLHGLRLSPSIPAAWDGFTMEKSFRGKKLHITVQNPAHKESGFTSLMLNGAAMPDNYIPADKLAAENEIVLTM